MINNPARIAEKYFERDVLQKIKPYFDKPEVVAIVGPRQVGKTTLLTHINEKLKKKSKTRFITFEDRKTLEIFDNDITSFIKLFVDPNQVLFIDEFQYAKDAGQKLKYIYDTTKSKIFISGSSSLEIKDIGKFMVGRIFTFMLTPLSFKEYLRAKDHKLYDLIEDYFFDWSFSKVISPHHIQSRSVQENIKNYFMDYLIYGGYPRVVSAKGDEERGLVLTSIIDNYLLREIRSLLKLATENELINLARFLSLQIGNLISYQELSVSSGLSFREVKKHINILKETFIADFIYPYFRNRRTELVKNSKVYFVDNGIRNRIIDNFSNYSLRADIGAIAENYVYNLLKNYFGRVNFWRTKAKAEVDFIVEKGGEILAIEVKLSPLTKIKIGKSLFSFIEKYSPRNVIVTTNDDFTTRKIGKTSVHFIPIYYLS